MSPSTTDPGRALPHPEGMLTATTRRAVLRAARLRARLLTERTTHAALVTENDATALALQGNADVDSILERATRPARGGRAGAEGRHRGPRGAVRLADATQALEKLEQGQISGRAVLVP